MVKSQQGQQLYAILLFGFIGFKLFGFSGSTTSPNLSHVPWPVPCEGCALCRAFVQCIYPCSKHGFLKLKCQSCTVCMRMCFTCGTCSFMMANPEEGSFITQCSDAIGPGYFGAVNFGVADHPFKEVASHIFSRENIWSTKTAAQPCSPDRFYACTGAYPLGYRLSQKMKSLFLFIFL